MSGSGNGIVRTQRGDVNLGPVLPGSEGELIEALKLPGPYARCNTSSVLPDNYTEQIAEQFPHDLPFGGHVGGELNKRDQSSTPQEEQYNPISYTQNSEEPNVGDTYKTRTLKNGPKSYYVYINGKKFELEADNLEGQTEAVVKITGNESAVLVNETYTVEVDRVSDSGDGIVYIEGDQMSIGKVDESVVGSEIRVKLRGLEELEVVNKDKVRKTHITEVDRISNSGNGVVYIDGDEMVVGSIDRDLVGSKIKVAVEDSQFATPIDTSIAERANNAPEADGRDSQKTNDDVSSGDVTSADYSDVSLSKLRSQAVNESKQSISSQTTSKSTKQYNRSEKVKQYVKKRAKGMCEGCEKEAPFVSKTGDPYLHAHHVYELSEGGADTPGTVIALCPNCHYRVHHGQDGQEYNQELIEKLEEIEPK